MPHEMVAPWKLERNNKYIEIIKLVLGLSSASAALPVLWVKNQATGNASNALKCDGSIVAAWLFIAMAISFGLAYIYLSAKWIRSAW